MKKISTIKLLGILVLLILIYAATDFFSTAGRSKSFKEVLVNIDTASVSKIEIKKELSILNLELGDNNWEVSTDGKQVYMAEKDKVKNMLVSLQTIKPSRIASRNPEKWQEFQVDSTGTRVAVFEGKKNTLDIIIGRFGMKGQQQFYSFVRLADDDNVYVADNFMGFSIPSDEASYRNQTVTNFPKDSVNSVRYSYPADSSFSLLKSLGGQWVLDDYAPDSTKTAQFINTLSRLSSSKFANTSNTSALAPLFTASIEIVGQDAIQLNAFAKNDSTFIITTSQNPEGTFEDSSLFDKIFKSRSSFYPEESDSQEE